jgi:hypothetical protein
MLAVLCVQARRHREILRGLADGAQQHVMMMMNLPPNVAFKFLM